MSVHASAVCGGEVLLHMCCSLFCHLHCGSTKQVSGGALGVSLACGKREGRGRTPLVDSVLPQ